MRSTLQASFIAIIFLLSVYCTSFAQSPGLIYRPASSGGNLVLDPNGDGYVSAPRVPAGFAGTRDEGAGFSEITYRPFPALVNEPLGDLNTGSSGGHTDLAPSNYTGSTGSPISAYYNGKQVMFRVRLGGASTASKGYSVMIDTDGVFGDLVEGGNPATTPNPGFEFEVVFASNFDVSIYDHRSKPAGGAKIWSGSVDQFSQRAVAASTGSNNPDYFYDFYVPLSAFPTTGDKLLTASTPLRFSGITITSAQSGITGTVSDVGGVNFASSYGFSKQKAWADVVNSFPATSLNQLQSGEFGKIQAAAPVIVGPITAGATIISGTSIEATGSIITVFRGGTAIGTTTVNANGTWSVALTGLELAVDNVITATLAPTSKSVSAASAPITVVEGVCRGNEPPVITGLSGSVQGTRYISFTPSFSGNQVITVYTINATPNTIVSTDVLNLTAGTTYIVSSANAGPVNANLATTTNTSYVITSTPTDDGGVATGCQSLPSNQICTRNGSNATIVNYTVTITSATYDGVEQTPANNTTWSEVPANLSSLSVTLSPGTVSGNLVLYKNGVETSATVPFIGSSTIATYNITDIGSKVTPALVAGDVLSVRAVPTTGDCVGPSSLSNLLTVQETTAAPTITAPVCGKVVKLTGTSSEAAGTVLQFYTGGTAGQRNGTLVAVAGTGTPGTAITAIVSSQGIWSADFSAAAGGGIAAGTFITARAKMIGKVRSVNSNAVSSSLPAAVPGGAAFSIDPVTEPTAAMQLVTIRGMGPLSTAGNTYFVTVDINGTVFAPVPTNATGQWELVGISPQEVYAGATVSAFFRSDANACPSDPISTPVLCSPPSGAFTTTLTGTTPYCYNSRISVILSGSEKGVSYSLFTNNNVLTGASVVGTGGAIVLTSGPLTNANTTLSVRAVDVGSECATTNIGGTLSFTVLAAPSQPSALVASTLTGCAVVTTNLTLNGPIANTSYQLINFDTKAPIGVAQVIGGTPPASVVLASNVTVYATTNFGLLITPNGGCTSESNATATVTVAEGPSLTQAVTIDKPAPCSGEQVTISVSTQYNQLYTYVILDNLNNQIGTSFTGTGGLVSRTTTYPTGVTAACTFRVLVTGGCATNAQLVTTVTATPATTAPAANAGTAPAQPVCGQLTLNANNASPGVGTWTIVGGIPAGVVFSSIHAPNATVTGLPSGSHTFTWTIVNTCGGANTTTSSSVTIIVNCPAELIVAAPRFATQYKSGDVLASALDADGSITAAGVVEGFTLPAWAQVLSNGDIVVSSGMTPVAGTYSFTVRTTDIFGFSTDTPLTLTIYGDEPQVAPLPVELVYFTAVIEKARVKLRWQTATEENNDKFVVERSANGKDFEAVGTVKGNGNSSRAITYSFSDNTPLAGTAYYRLRQVDFDGQEGFSNVIAVMSNGIVNNLQLQAYPNPFTSFVTVAVTSPTAEKAQLQLLDMQGRVVLTKAVELNKGLTQLELEVQAVAGGFYTLRVAGNGIEAKARVIKTH